MTQNANFDKFRDMIGFWKKISIKNTFHVGHLILVTLTPNSNSKNNLLHTGPKCAICENPFQTESYFHPIWASKCSEKKNSIKDTFQVGHLILVTLSPKSNSKNNLLHTGPRCATCEKTFQTKELFPSNICFDEVFLVQACQSMSLQPYFMSGLRL